MPSAAFARLNRRVSTAARKFKVSALTQINPGLRGDELVQAVARETLRDSAYYAAMRRRLAEGVSLVEQDPTLAPTERSERYKALESIERRYLRQHMEAAAFRMASDAEISVLKERGEPGGVWVLGNTQNHTADCVAMAGRFWRWDVLDKVRPSNRHNGCDCRIISATEADRRGIDYIRGYRSPAMRRNTEFVEAMIEAATKRIFGATKAVASVIFVPNRSGRGGTWHYTGGPRGGQFAPKDHTAIVGDLEPSMRPEVDKMLSAAEEGDIDAVERHFSRASAKAKKITRKPNEDEEAANVRSVADENLRTLSRLRAAVYNPEGRRVPIGSRPTIAGRPRPVPLAVPSSYGLIDPWASSGGFAWFLPDAAMGSADERRRFLSKMRGSGAFTVKRKAGGAIIETKRGLDELHALAAARELEVRLPQLRTNRIVEEGEALGDDRPLDLHEDEIDFAKAGGHASRYPDLPGEGVGLAGEALIEDVKERLVALGVVDADAVTEIFGIEGRGKGTKEAALDWALGGIGVEVKSEAFRGMRALRPREGQDKGYGKQQAAKIAFADAKGLRRGAFVKIYVDLDSDTAYVFWRGYGPDEGQHAPKRVPKEMLDKMFAGELQPGERDIARGRGEDERYSTIFVGALPLRYNPLRPSRAGREQVRAGKEPSAEQIRKMVSAPAPSRPRDVGAPPVEPKAPAPPATGPLSPSEERAVRDVEIIRRTRDLGQGQSQIARELKISQPTVNRALEKHAKETGEELRPGKKGVRTDRARTRRKKSSAKRR